MEFGPSVGSSDAGYLQDRTGILQTVYYNWILQRGHYFTLLFLKLFLKLNVFTVHCHGQNRNNILWYHTFLASKVFCVLSCVLLIKHISSNFLSKVR